MPVNLPQGFRKREELKGPPIVGKGTSLPVFSLPRVIGDELSRNLDSVRAIIKLGAPKADYVIGELRKGLARRLPVALVLAAAGEGLESIRGPTYHLLGALRIDTKRSGRLAGWSRPAALHVGITVLDLRCGEPARSRPFPVVCPQLELAARSRVRASNAVTD